MRQVNIEVIPHGKHREEAGETFGDWWFDEDEVLQIRVSAEAPYELIEGLIVHELIEAMLCQAHGVGTRQVDEWDTKMQDHPWQEPGDLPGCPYRKEHTFAFIMEKMYLAERIKPKA